MLLVLGVLLALAALAVASHLALGAPSPPPTDGASDWEVVADTTVEGRTIALGGDLVVLPGATLELHGCTLVFSGASGQALDVRRGGELLAEGCTITAADGASGFTFSVLGRARLSRCDVSRAVGGVQAWNDGLLVEGCRIHDCDGPAIELHGHDARITGCELYSVDVGVSSVVGPEDVSLMAMDGWNVVVADTTITGRTNGVLMTWNKTLTGDLDLDFTTVISNVNISGSSSHGILLHADLKDNSGSGALDSLFDLKVTGGFSKSNGGSGIHIGHYIKPTSVSGTHKVTLNVELASTKLNSNTAHGLSIQDTYNCQQGAAPTITVKHAVSLTNCEVSSNGRDGIHIDRPKTVYYGTGTGDKGRTYTLALTDTSVKSNKDYGIWTYDWHYAYSARGKLLWSNTVKLVRSAVESNGKDGIWCTLYEQLYYGDRVGVDYKQVFDLQDSAVGKNGRNGLELGSSGYMYYHGTMTLTNELRLTRTRLHNNTGLAGNCNWQMYGYDWQYTFYRKGGWWVDQSVIEDNVGGGLTGKAGGWSWYSEFDMVARVLNSHVRNNGADKAVYLEGMSGNKGEALITGNVFEGNGGGGGSTCVDMVYFSQFVAYANTFHKETHRALLRFYGLGTPGPSPNVGPKYSDWVQIYENVFEDCDVGTSSGDGVAVIDSYQGDGSLLFVDNVVRGGTGNGLAANRVYGKGTLVAKRNTFEAIGGSAFSIASSSSGAKFQISENTMGNGTGSTQSAFVRIQDDASAQITITDNLAEDSSCAGVVSTGSAGPAALVVRNNRLLGLGGNAVDLLGNKFTVEGNELRDCKGFAIALRGFTSLPTVGVNSITGAENGLLLEAKPRTDGKRLKVFMDNVTWQVTETAIATDHMDLVVTNSTLTGRRALTASDGTITTISTRVPYMSGSTDAAGRIEVYYLLGLNLTWANATGAQSGLPCPDALVVFRRSTGSYYTSRIASPEGTTVPELFPAWMVVEGHPDRISPYDLEITASGLTTHATLPLDDDMQSEVSVVDWALPAISVEKPYAGALVNTQDLTVKGFLTEMGSGLAGAWASMDGQTWSPVEAGDVWSVRFTGLEHGPARLYAKAMDRSGNVNITRVDFQVDLLGPDLEVIRPLDRSSVRDSYIVVEATTERTAELFLDGVPVPNRQGVMFERMTLRQGLNIIVVEAVDGSGNAAIEVLHVWLDTVAPALFVSSPVDGSVAASPLVAVEGRTELDATVTVNDEPVALDGAGWFRTTRVLTGRENLLIVAAEDRAGNVNSSYVRVTLDDQPPSFQIGSPADGALTAATQVVLEGSLGQEDLDASVYVNGQRVEQVGRFTATVVLVEGENRITVDVVDPNGRSSTQVVRVVRDTTAPLIALTSPPATTWTTRDGRLMVQGTAATASELWVGNDRARLEADGSFNHTFQLQAGPNTVELMAKDAALNERTVVLSITWDPSPPDLRVDAPPPTTEDEYILVNGSTDGAIVRIDGVPVPVVDGTFSVPVHLSLGTSTFTITSEDEAGNVATHQLTVERTEPTSVEARQGLPVDMMTLVPLLVALVALLATAAMLRRAPQQVAARRDGRRRPHNGNGNGHGNANGNGHANGNGNGYMAAPPLGAVETMYTPASASATEPVMVDLGTVQEPQAAAPSEPSYEPQARSYTRTEPEFAPTAPVYDPSYARLYGPAEGAYAPAAEPPAYVPPPPPPEPVYAPLPEPVYIPPPEPVYAPAREPAYDTASSAIPYEAVAPRAAPELKLEFAPLPVYSVPDPATASVVDVGSNGEYAPKDLAAPAIEPGPVIAAAEVSPTPPPAAPAGPLCSKCGSALEPEWILCPDCETPTGVEPPPAPEPVPAHVPEAPVAAALPATAATAPVAAAPMVAPAVAPPTPEPVIEPPRPRPRRFFDAKPTAALSTPVPPSPARAEARVEAPKSVVVAPTAAPPATVPVAKPTPPITVAEAPKGATERSWHEMAMERIRLAKERSRSAAEAPKPALEPPAPAVETPHPVHVALAPTPTPVPTIATVVPTAAPAPAPVAEQEAPKRPVPAPVGRVPAVEHRVAPAPRPVPKTEAPARPVPRPVPVPSTTAVTVKAPETRPRPVAAQAPRPVPHNAPQDVSRPHIRSRFFSKPPETEAAPPVRPPERPTVTLHEPVTAAAPAPSPSSAPAPAPAARRPVEQPASTQASRVKAALDELLEELDLEDDDEDEDPRPTAA